MRARCQTRSQVDGSSCARCASTRCLDVVLMLHACGHCFHRDCGQEASNALRKYEKPRCPNRRATLDTAPFGKLLGQRRQLREKRACGTCASSSPCPEVCLIPRALAREASAEGHPRPPPSPQPSSNDVDRYPLCFSFFFQPRRHARSPLAAPTRLVQEYMKSKNWRVPKRNAPSARATCSARSRGSSSRAARISTTSSAKRRKRNACVSFVMMRSRTRKSGEKKSVATRERDTSPRRFVSPRTTTSTRSGEWRRRRVLDVVSGMPAVHRIALVFRL